MILGPFGGRSVAISGLLTLTKVTEVFSRTIPGNTQEGDLIVALVWSPEGAGAYTPLSGFNVQRSIAGSSSPYSVDGTQARLTIYTKVADSNDEGDQFDDLTYEYFTSTGGAEEGFPGFYTTAHTYVYIVILRGNRKFTSILAGAGAQFQLTAGNPAAQVINVAPIEPPLIVWGLYAASATPNPRTMTPAKTGETLVIDRTELGGVYKTFLAWKLWPTDPEATTVDMNDMGTSNMLSGWYSRVFT
jgi:hypothetical protein